MRAVSPTAGRHRRRRATGRLSGIAEVVKVRGFSPGASGSRLASQHLAARSGLDDGRLFGIIDLDRLRYPMESPAAVPAGRTQVDEHRAIDAEVEHLAEVALEADPLDRGKVAEEDRILEAIAVRLGNPRRPPQPRVVTDVVAEKVPRAHQRVTNARYSGISPASTPASTRACSSIARR